MELSYNKGDVVTISANIRPKHIDYVGANDRYGEYNEVGQRRRMEVVNQVIDMQFVVTETRYDDAWTSGKAYECVDQHTLYDSSYRWTWIQTVDEHPKYGRVTVMIDDRMIRPTVETFNRMFEVINHEWNNNWSLNTN